MKSHAYLLVFLFLGCGGGAGPTTSWDLDFGGLQDRGDFSGGDEASPGDYGADYATLEISDSYETSQGGFLSPCHTNSDCASGFCVEGPEGPICTKTCLGPEDCPEDFVCIGTVVVYPDLVFLCVPKFGRICAACTTDTQCAGGRCIDLPDGKVCSVPCSKDDECAAPYRCVHLDGHEDGYCLPPSQTCACRPKDAGVKRLCERSNEFGTCYGYETCDPEVGFTGCDARVPAPEECNGIDDDCDGLPDNGLQEGEPCEIANEYGSCPGSKVCLGPKGWACSARVPTPEECDGLDNDCDGETDEDFKIDGKYALIEHCGGCYKSCLGLFPHAEAVCDTTGQAPRCVVAKCEVGYIKLNDYQCIPAASTLCQPCASDFDCLIPGAACIEMEDGSYCGQPCVAPSDCPPGYDCTNFAAYGYQCVPHSGTCACTSANPNISKTCSVTYVDPTDPQAPTYTCHGVQHCLEDGWGPCELPPEVCDHKDNDCDGLTDEGFRDDVTGKYPYDENCGECGNNCKAMKVPFGYGKCEASKAIPECVPACNEGFFNVDGNPANGCECQYLGPTDRPGEDGGACVVEDCSDANCDGIDGEVDNGIFVAKYGSDSNPGTMEAPLLTIQAGIDRAASLGKRDVYVATGVYGDPVFLRPGVSVYGGYSADFHKREPLAYETVILGAKPTGTIKAAVHAIGIQGKETVFSGFIIYGYNNREPGGNSMAIFVKDSDGSLRFEDLTVIAGDGGNGLPGAPGMAGEDGMPGQPGLPAYDIGQNNCTSAKENPGGLGGQKVCGGVAVHGGSGGRAICPDFDELGACNEYQTRKAVENGANGLNNAPGYGQGGLAGLDAIINPACNILGSCGLCTVPTGSMIGGDGLPGSPGANGVAGLPCSASSATVVGDTWVPGKGGDGGNGGHGGGGGGGGAAGGVETVGCGFTSSKYSDIGGSGGGGGSGGCGATGGKGGTSGGGSFGFFMVFSSTPLSLPILKDVLIRPGRGGDGGNGGNGGVGGKGGSGAPGGPDAQGQEATFCTSQGGHGGNGGPGGHGGGGGGGCGGPAYGIFVHGAPSALLQAYKTASITFDGNGQGGKGGLGGASLGNPGAPGEPGVAAPMNF